MKFQMDKRYLLNGFLLVLPILIWNILLYEQLPAGYQSDIFDKNIPSVVAYPENILRILALGLPMIMRLSLNTKKERAGLLLYIFGVTIYFASWLAVIYFPDSAWGKSPIGYTAPAHTTIFWLIGIGLVGHQSYFKIRSLSLLYIGIAVLFVLFHTSHAYIVFRRVAGA